MRRARGAVLAALGLSCHAGKPADGPPLDGVLVAGQARAGKVTKESELIGGPVAYGRVGDVWKLYNARARFLIQDVGVAVGLDLYGGNLIDVDLVRPGDNGKNGNDLFREAFPLVGLSGVNPSAIEVVSDGTKGGPAILRVRGTDAPTDILPQIDDLAQGYGGEVTVDYELAADVPYLKITTTYRARAGQSILNLGLGDFLSFGASLAVVSPENGFTGGSKTVTFLASSGEGTSYGYVYPAGNLSIPIVDASGTAALLVSQPVPEGGSLSVTRYLVVGGGDAASVSGPMYALRGIATALLSGRVLDGQTPVAGARVTLFRAPYSAASTCIDQAKSAADGSYRFEAPPGEYVAITGGIGRVHGAATAISLGMDGVAGRDLPVGGFGQVSLDIGEGIGGARLGVPAKVSFSSQNAERPDARFGPDPTENERFGLSGVALTPDGKGTLLLKPGTYRATVSRGPEYELTIVDNIVLAAGGTATLKADLTRVVDTTGWLAGDYHQHTQGSIDSPVPVRERVIEDMAEGVEFPAATDHDNVTDFRPHIAALGPDASRFINAMIGNEISVNGVGHFNGYPLTVDAADPYAKVGAKFWARRTIRELTVRVHAEPQEAVLHVSHPRTNSLAGFFNAVKFDPTTGLAARDFPIDGFDALEVNSDLATPAYFLAANDAAVHKKSGDTPSGIPAMRDFFGLLNLGKTLAALGNSDTHGRNDGSGWPRSFVFVGTDDPRAAKEGDIVAAIKAQKVTVSNGLFVTTTLNGQPRMGRGEVVALAGAASASLGVKVQAPSWIDAASFEVYANGRPLPLARKGPGAFEQRAEGDPGAVLSMALDPAEAKGKVVRLDGAVIVKPARDTWYVVVARGGKSMSPVAAGDPFGYTNPVYVDTAADGWTAPGVP
ncbi:MAG: hypothetical protein EXR72_03190 [Myxococcales bacterium]|nr:hypothetical protein [Myxococcales bacterium]